MRVAAIFGGEMYRLEKDEINGGTAHFGAYAEPFTSPLAAKRHARIVLGMLDCLSERGSNG